MRVSQGEGAGRVQVGCRWGVAPLGNRKTGPPNDFLKIAKIVY